MSNFVLKSILPIINQLQPFLENGKGIDVSLDFRERLINYFMDFERESYSKSLPAKKIEDIKYALAALADECIMNSQWSEKLSWMRRSLQLQFFGDHSAGEGFFERLSQLRQAGVVEIEVLEIYVLCLQLGFKGIYRFKDNLQWTTLLSSLENQVEMTRGKTEVGLVLSQSQLLEEYKKHSRKIPLWWVGVVTISIIFFICLGYNLASRLQLHHAIQNLNAGLSYDS